MYNITKSYKFSLKEHSSTTTISLFLFQVFLYVWKKKRDGTKWPHEMFLNVLINPACNNNSLRYYYIIKFIRHGFPFLSSLGRVFPFGVLGIETVAASEIILGGRRFAVY